MNHPDPNESMLLDHEYDGIKEYDNPLPRWWVWTWWATIIFSVLYWFNVPGIGIGQGQIADYEAEMAVAEAQRAQLAALRPGPTEQSLLALKSVDSTLALGQTTFGQMCVACHGPDGGGVIGPNLTDDAWIHGESAMEVYTIVNEGVLAKGMPAWGTMLSPAQVEAVVAYVMSLRGTTPASPKAPEGVVGDAAVDTASGSPPDDLS
ncbi:MAG: cbb3-type cytochrome c oxidase N-terminal domain-containing protein [Gemmatimonadota bacterium]|nr:cbb3-type cytochrome c oxidase N-terminal domain-containing protein [Gemmatimonadota bacterium]